MLEARGGRRVDGIEASFQRYEERMGENVTIDFSEGKILLADLFRV